MGGGKEKKTEDPPFFCPYSLPPPLLPPLYTPATQAIGDRRVSAQPLLGVQLVWSTAKNGVQKKLGGNCGMGLHLVSLRQ